MFQHGVLRSNCIDCLDRTNVAQYALGLAALGRQMHVLGLCSVPRVASDSGLAVMLMEMYENMGDALAVQYGGSAAHNKVYNLYYSYILHLGICVHHTFVKKWVHLILRKLTWKMLLNFWQVFSQHQGRWNATIQSLEFFRSIQRHYNNAYLDSEKQDAIDM